MSRYRRLRMVAFLLVSASPGLAYAISGTDKVATKGTPVADDPGWFEGAVDVINDPVRGGGWNHWFSECPNDLRYYEMAVSGPGDINRIARAMAKVKGEGVQIRLDPAADASHANHAGAVFSLGNQAITNAWFLQLPRNAVGVRTFGVNAYLGPPIALPPTLTLYTGHKAVDLEKLELPVGVEVVSAFSEAYKKAHSGDGTVAAIERFVAKHRAKRIAAGIVDAAD